jgi:hypothetical protein
VNKVINQFQNLKTTSAQNQTNNGTPTNITGTGTTLPTPPAGGASNVLSNIDNKLSNLGSSGRPGSVFDTVAGTIGSGIYNAGKGLVNLGTTAVKDLASAAVNPAQAASNVGKFLGNELTQTETPNADAVQSLFQSTLGSKGALGVGQQLGNAVTDLTGETQNKFSGGKFAGNALNSVLTALTGGQGSTVEAGLKTAVDNGLLEKGVADAIANAAKSFAGRSAESGAIGAGFQAASNLQTGAPITSNLGKGFATGAAMPGVIQAGGSVFGLAGDLAKKTTGMGEVTGEEAAKILANAIGFRGGNRIEMNQFNKSAPVVLDELKANGFKLTDNSDPNNIINLQKAVDTAKTQIINERNTRIKNSGGLVAPLEGRSVGDALREIPAENPKLFFEKPELAARIEALAKQYDSKIFTPEEAQQFIKTSNKTFDFGNQDTAFQNLINDKISKSLTDALDKHVANGAGADAGTAVLNKRWSALKTFSDQLDKKVMMEQRKAPADLATRINVPEAAGKIAEGIANPLGAFGKAAGAGAQYLVNRVMGERNNVNYRIWKAFNGSPAGEAIVGELNKATAPGQVSQFLQNNPLVKNMLQRIYGVTDTASEKPAIPTISEKPVSEQPVTNQTVFGRPASVADQLDKARRLKEATGGGIPLQTDIQINQTTAADRVAELMKQDETMNRAEATRRVNEMLNETIKKTGNKKTNFGTK